MARVTLAGLSKRYPQRAGESVTRPALDQLDLDVADGELLVLVGPSGCGKSTTLRLVAGLDEPSAGSIRIGEREVSAVAPQHRDVAMVFQGYALYPHMTVRQNVAFPLEMRGVKASERERRVRSITELVGLGGKLERLPSELSGGERQRVAMARAMVREPQVFLFDEPLSNLDAKLRAELRVELVALLRRLGTTAMYVTHDQAEAMTMGDRVAVLDRGTLQQLDTPRRVYERPANTFVAAFVGSPQMALLPLDALPTPPAGLPSGAATLGFRPEHGRLCAAGEGSAEELSLAATVTGKELLGAETIVHLQHGEERLSVRVPGFGGPEPGAEVTVAVAPQRLHVFGEDGVRLRELS